MKRILLSIVAILILTTSFAQEEVNYFEKKNEINIQVDNIFAKQNIYDYYFLDNDYTEPFLYNIYFPDLVNNTSIGIGYKHHFSKGAIRVKGSLSIFARNYRPDEDNKENKISFASYYERISAGYEFHKEWGRTQVFFGIDGTVGFQTFISEENLVDHHTGESNDYRNVSATISYGVMPFLGFRYHLSPVFSISTEYHLLMEGFTSKYKTERNGTEDDNIPQTNGFRTQFGPKGQITFSFHF